LNIDASEEDDPCDPVPSFVIEKLEGILGEELLLCCPEAGQYEQVELSVSFLSGEDMRKINKDHRGIDEATDVLSFPLWEENGCFSPKAPFALLPLGDILICPEEAKREHEPSSALFLMLAHGFLHLLAWDHDTPEKERAMWERQEFLKSKLLQAAGEVR
jgi:probable rRNA maturation factor